MNNIKNFNDFKLSGITISFTQWLIKLKNKPIPPISRVIREGSNNHCIYCGSTISKDGLFRLFGEKLCHNKKCFNSKPKYIR